MARILKIDLCGSLKAYTYASLIRMASELQQMQAEYEEALKEGETVYSWETPPEAILLTVSSSGGELLGLLPAMQAMRELTKIIPIVGVASGQACSAGYMLLTACSTIIALKGTELGSIAAATGYQDTSKMLEEKGIVPYFFSTHSDKFTGMPGENKSPEAIQAYLKEVAIDSFALLEDFMASQRPGISKEIKRLNGSTFIVKGANSVLFDYTADSIFEVVATLETMELTMFKFKKSTPATAAASVRALGQAASSDNEAPASLVASVFGKQGATASADQASFSIATAAEALTKDTNFIAALAAAVAKAMTVPPATLQPAVEEAEGFVAGAVISSTASMDFLLAKAKALKATDNDVIQVAALGLTEEASTKVMHLLVAARDKAQTVTISNSVLTNAESLNTEGGSEENTIVAALKAKVAALKGTKAQ